MQKEGSHSHRQAKSHEEKEARPDTPEFNLESDASSEGNDNDQEDQIRARMEAQIQGFDDDN